MRFILISAIVLALSGCNNPAQSEKIAALQDQVNAAEARAVKAQTEINVMKAEREAEDIAAAALRGERPVAVSSPSNEDTAPNEPGCWQDYCPCEEDGDMDRMICRNLRAGLHVKADTFATAAALRDSRRSMDNWKRENPDM
jgi:hypothetical protein